MADRNSMDAVAPRRHAIAPRRHAIARRRHAIGALILAAVLAPGGVRASDASLPDLAGQWVRPYPHSQWDPSRPRGLQQQAPLTAEYQAIFEANLAELHAGNLGADPQVYCLPSGMPRMMIAYEPMEVIVTATTIYVRMEHLGDFRRIYIDGRDWPAEIPLSFDGYSIGTWTDQDGSGRYDMLEVETRGLKGPRTFDADGLPLHRDNQTVVKERIYLDRADRDLLHDEITTIDHALTRPWTVTRNYTRAHDPVWNEYICAEANSHVGIGRENYFLSADGLLMPARKDQPPPDLRYFRKR